MKQIIVLPFFLLFLSGCVNEHLSPSGDVVIKTDPEEHQLFKSTPKNSTAETKQKIYAFRAFLKSIETGSLNLNARDADLTSEELEWNIEANLNMTYTRADLPFDNMEIEENSFSVPMTDGKISPDNVFNAYNSALSYLESHYISSDFENKNVLNVNMVIEDVATNELTLKIKSYIVNLDGSNSITGECFEIFDECKWCCNATPQGSCCGVSSSSYDGADLLTYELNSRLPAVQPLTFLFFTDCVEIDIVPHYFSTESEPFSFYFFDWEDDVMEDIQPFYGGNREQVVFHRLLPSPVLITNVCLDVDDMNWLYCGSFSLVQKLMDDYDKEFISLMLEDEHYNSPVGLAQRHMGVIVLGTAHLCGCPNPCPIPDPCECC